MVGQLQQRVVAEFGGVAEIGERVFADLPIDACALQVLEALRQRGVGVDASGCVLVEQARLTNQVEAAYRRTDFLEKRRELMAR